MNIVRSVTYVGKDEVVITLVEAWIVTVGWIIVTIDAASGYSDDACCIECWSCRLDCFGTEILSVNSVASLGTNRFVRIGICCKNLIVAYRCEAFLLIDRTGEESVMTDGPIVASRGTNNKHQNLPQWSSDDN